MPLECLKMQVESVRAYLEMCAELCVLPSAAAMAAFTKTEFSLKHYGFGPAAGETLGMRAQSFKSLNQIYLTLSYEPVPVVNASILR